ncbi:hypothetical protein [Notoacmeibacter sp. MSK16QG-6]|uniref:hypothetical protein n=1 Tax=Notoacmeibacter sp. MSK16QG-6 TaxID=2957982 RepID=UPI00209D0865|nr:hypothetical protein [Notoacmeibacter sp. MSK16QG-6]MCP1199787.1 hypothetical protein [Notoacmeibacter sp. MSK16QG-6]
MSALPATKTSDLNGRINQRPAPPSRRGACPSLDRPMETGDGLLIRLAPARSGLKAATVKTICELASRHGNGRLEVSRRGNLQIRGLTKQSVRHFTDEIAPVIDQFRFDLTIEASPLPEDDETGSAAMRIAARIEHEAEKTKLKAHLAPKFSIVIDAGGPVDYSGLKADIRLRRTAPYRWAVLLGGTEATGKFLGEVTEEESAVSVAALAALIATMGPKKRGHDLPVARARNALSCVSPSLLPAGASGTHFPVRRERVFDVGAVDVDASSFAIVSPAFGLMAADDLQSLTDAALTIAKPDRSDRLRFHTAPGRLIIIGGLSKDEAGKLLRHFATKPFITRPDDPRRVIACCVGHPACASAHFDTHGLAETLVARGISPDRDRPIHLSGCSKQCAKPARAALHIVGMAEGVDCLDPAGNPIARYTSARDTIRLAASLTNSKRGQS